MNASLREADPREVAAAWMQAMRGGHWDEAWRQTDRIELVRRARQAQPGFERQPHHLLWDGTPLRARRVLVRSLHGLGDTLHFMRYLPQVNEAAAQVHFHVQPQLLPLLQGGRGLGTVSNGWTREMPPHDVEIEVMELAYAFRSQPHSVPPPYPHLAAGVPRRLDLPLHDDALRIGLVWAASDWDPSRSVPLASLAPIFGLRGIRFYSLQQGEAAHEAGAHRWPLQPLSRHTQAVQAAAAAILQMDLVVCVDAMPAHLAATLGRPTWLLLKHEADWRWMHGRSDSPWYPGMRIFRQPAPGDWDALAAEVARALAQRISAPPGPRAGS